MSSAVAWTLWSGFLGDQTWGYTQPSLGLLISFPALAGHQNRLQGLHGFLFGYLNQAKLYTEFPVQTGHGFCSADGKATGYALFKGLCKVP